MADLEQEPLDMDDRTAARKLASSVSPEDADEAERQIGRVLESNAALRAKTTHLEKHLAFQSNENAFLRATLNKAMGLLALGAFLHTNECTAGAGESCECEIGQVRDLLTNWNKETP